MYSYVINSNDNGYGDIAMMNGQIGGMHGVGGIGGYSYDILSLNNYNNIGGAG
jgi:hypothetical protein